MFQYSELLLTSSMDLITIKKLANKKKYQEKKSEMKLEKRLMKKTMKRKMFENKTSVIFQATVSGVTVSKNFECFESMDDFAFVLFSHGYQDKEHVALSILVEKVDGSATTVYNYANMNYIKCFVNAQGGFLPKLRKMHLLAVHFCNDHRNGNPDLMISCFTTG